MIEEIGGEDAAPADAAGDTAAWALLGRASREKADAYLDEQTSLIRLQKEHLHEQRLLLLSHLKWRRFDDQLKGALQIMLVALSAVVVAAVGGAIWSATQADGLVIDDFSAPPSFAQQGITGEVVADDITSKLAAVRQFAMAHSFSSSKSVSADRKNELRVEIPDTGVSIAEAWRYLRNWLGHERHVSGSLREHGAGTVVLAVNVAGAPTISVTGPASDLDRLEQEAAEKIFAEIDPVNIVNYLSSNGQYPEAMAAAARFVTIADTPPRRADSYTLWSYTTAFATGDIALAIARAHVGETIYPKLAVTHLWRGREYFSVGEDEAALHETEAVLPLQDADQLPAHQGARFADMRSEAGARIAWLQGDFDNAGQGTCIRSCAGVAMLTRAIDASRRHDPVAAQDVIETAHASGIADPFDQAQARYFNAAAEGDWKAARDAANDVASNFAADHSRYSPRYVAAVTAARFVPPLAVAEAHLGQFAQAHRAIDATPLDCVECLRARGLIDMLQGNRAGAAWWFARAISEAPSIPFAYADWGEMLLRQGDYDAAIAKFKLASEKGPHFADPLEMWGEALMQKNRSDLAVAKFAEADKYSPNWGRLHLKWGEALFYAGKRDDAKKQFAIAAHLDLSQSDTAALAAWMKTHG